MDATRTTDPGGWLARLVSFLIALSFTVVTIYVFLLYLGQGSLSFIFGGLAPALAGPAAKTAEGVYTVIGRDILFDQVQIEAPAGRPLTINFRNAGSLEHSIVFELPSGSIGLPPDWQSGRGLLGGVSGTLNLPALAAGTYTYYCAVPGHRTTMNGQLTVK